MGPTAKGLLRPIAENNPMILKVRIPLMKFHCPLSIALISVSELWYVFSNDLVPKSGVLSPAHLV